MELHQPRPSGVPRRKMWILPTALEDLDESDGSVKNRLLTELRKDHFVLERVVSAKNHPLYRVRLGDHHRGTVHKERDQFFIMRIIPKKSDQRGYNNSAPPSVEELRLAERLPEPLDRQQPDEIEFESREALLTPGEGMCLIPSQPPETPVWVDSSVETVTTSTTTDGSVHSTDLPRPIHDVLQQLQSVFLYFDRQQSNLFDALTEVSEVAEKNDKALSDERSVALRRSTALSQELAALSEQLRELIQQTRTAHEQLQVLQSRAANTDNRLAELSLQLDTTRDISTRQIQSMEPRLSELQLATETIRGRMDRSERTFAESSEVVVHLRHDLGELQGLVDGLRDWRQAHPELRTQLEVLSERVAANLGSSQTEWSSVREQLLDRDAAYAAVQVKWQQAEQSQEERCARLTAELSRTVAAQAATETANAALRQDVAAQQQRLRELEERLARAERRGIWSLIFGT